MGSAPGSLPETPKTRNSDQLPPRAGRLVLSGQTDDIHIGGTGPGCDTPTAEELVQGLNLNFGELKAGIFLREEGLELWNFCLLPELKAKAQCKAHSVLLHDEISG